MTLRVAIGSDACLVKHALQLFLHFLARTFRDDGAHCLKAEHLHAFLKGNPKTMEAVLAYIACAVAAQGSWRCRIAKARHLISVIAYQSASVRAYPYETV